ncbi:hypothetical protein SAY87_028383 [Trapa incisa]|uniref:Uncharacterized protein n=1 Tax=Trapa incisa TaxID=236973 RepID=A0AAN7KVK3_9MYRT|nr:hypothetical protein SAY87_028383 [Trapa incisa]
MEYAFADSLFKKGNGSPGSSLGVVVPWTARSAPSLRAGVLISLDTNTMPCHSNYLLPTELWLFRVLHGYLAIMAPTLGNSRSSVERYNWDRAVPGDISTQPRSDEALRPVYSMVMLLETPSGVAERRLLDDERLRFRAGVQELLGFTQKTI